MLQPANRQEGSVITEAAIAERQSAQREEHLLLALEAGRMGTWEWIVATGEVRWSEGLERIHGLVPGTFEGTFEAYRREIHPDDIAAVEAGISKTFEGADHNLQYRIVLPSGEIRWVEGRGKVFRDAEGNPERVIGVCADVTERKHVEQALAQQARVQSVLYELTDRLNRASNLQEVYDSALDCILKAVNCDRASLLLFDEEDVMRFVAWRGLSDDYRKGTTGHSPWTKGEANAEPICVENIDTAGFSHELHRLIRDEGIRSLCFIPLQGDKGLIGKFMVYFDRPYSLNEQELDLAITISRQLATGIEYKQAENALQQSEQSLRLALEAGRMGTWEWTVGSEKVKWSPSLQLLFGFEANTFPGTMAAYRDRIHPEDRESILGRISESLATSNNHEVEHRVLLPDGSVRWVEGRGRVFRDDAGNPVRMVGVSTDITGRKQTEHDMRFLAEASSLLSSLTSMEESLQQLATIAVPEYADWCAVDLLDETGQLNRVAVAHVDPERVRLAQELAAKYPPDPNAPTGVWNILRTGKSEMVHHITDELLDATVSDPEIRRVLDDLGLRSYMGIPLKVRGQVLGVITFISAESGRLYDSRDLAVVEDLAHRAAVAIENGRLYQELKDADRRKDRFLATLAHELRNPLAPIRHALDVLANEGLDEETRDDARATMHRQLSHMVRLVDDLLDISRITQDKLKLQPSRVEAQTIIRQAVESAEPIIRRNGQSIFASLPREPIWLDADRTRLVQVVSNLINNASKFSDANTRILVAANVKDGRLTIKVADEGIGIPPELLGSVFDMFTQGPHADFKREAGLGIGLSLAKRLVELHGGTICATSQGIGHGSEFVIQLPIAEVQESSVGLANPDAGIGSNPKRILVVDDNVDAARMLATMLRIWGHTTEIASDGESALDLVDAFKPDVVLLDLGLPGISGYEAAEQITKMEDTSSMTLIAISGWGQDEDRIKSKAAGFAAHLVKPVSAEALGRALNSVKSMNPQGR